MSADWTTSPGFDRSERWHAAKARRAYDALNVKPLTVTGATLAAETAVAAYDNAAAKRDDLVAEASAPLLLLIAKDRLVDAGVALRFELSKVAEHKQAAVHGMQAQERLADRGRDLVARLLAALVAAGGDADVVADAMSFLHGPDCHEQEMHDAAVASARQGSAYPVASPAEAAAFRARLAERTRLAVSP